MADRSELADFLGAHPPFQGAPPAVLAEVAAAAVEREYGSGAWVVDPRRMDVSTDTDTVWVVHTGRVVIMHPDATSPTEVPIDTIGEGGVFGFSALLSGGTVEFRARALEPSVVLQLPGALVRPLFATPTGLAFLADAVNSSSAYRGGPVEGSAGRTVGELLSAPAVFVPVGTTVRDAVRHMTDQGSSYVLVPLRGSRHGIFTDRDLRIRVVAAGIGVDTPIEQVMTAPAETVTADRLAGTVLMDMLELGLRHMLVVSDRGEVLGVVEDSDLHAASTRRSFVVRRAVASASTSAELADAGRLVPRLVVDLFQGGTDAMAVSAILSVVVDSIVRRAVEIEWTARPDVPRDRFAWITLGSVARREAMPSSDVDSALSWADTTADPEVRGKANAVQRTRDEALMDLAARVHESLDGAGLPSDTNGAVASSPRFARSAGQWERAAAHWLSNPFGQRGNPAEDSGLIMSSLMIDGRVVWGPRELHTVPEAYRRLLVDHPDALRLQLRDALAGRARLRSLRDVLARRGGTFDLKAHALTPIVNLARWGGLSVGMASASTPARLAAASGNGMLSERDVTALSEVFALLQRLRLSHQIDQITAGHRPGDVLIMADLSPLERSLLTDGIREIAAVQRRVGYLAANVGVHR
ncbi:cyclic nucleotide-binding protein [Rhodococcus sp. 15-725-2-2b]|uniref:putative nucleotidyltransferase substrate binding domain-containing protein n=1 Tax=unclassified Rhodococcus (in: high G+C Gram-positive bacteria) TaxID=192944 RepID=UPI000B9B9C5F|nr:MULTISPECIES: putative nucleotidyltransferase substrate binding domain-containing protein [unclassified Rhodococcus (in: high G+C Gram-positive bacteria)]OZC71783.1 cyclic nucleotide-binding protein [Rhodococcus sp. 06-469-3-2]OZD42572.1 cyclic nucleotide-binding protein [Rhodococcus sp. 06-1477-1A]OZE68278.1 cyclic nucleotide-binding protein [Rhodococcus sp. 15-725-2-2b]